MLLTPISLDSVVFAQALRSQISVPTAEWSASNRCEADGCKQTFGLLTSRHHCRRCGKRCVIEREKNGLLGVFPDGS